jgi:hypothetical protein
VFVTGAFRSFIGPAFQVIDQSPVQEVVIVINIRKYAANLILSVEQAVRNVALLPLKLRV